jgi:hypothetical protein
MLENWWENAISTDHFKSVSFGPEVLAIFIAIRLIFISMKKVNL